jgi:oligopeptide/dipeptide ABC transporter ATP-binding protein
VSEYVLDVRNLTIAIERHGRTTTVVRDVSFAVEPGDALGIVGESGCGKSMTLRALLGILPRGARLTSGSVWFEGRCVVRDGVDHGLAALRGGGIGLVFQDATSALNPVMRIGNQIGEGLRRHADVGRRASHLAAVDTLRSLGFPAPERQQRQFPHELSGGMRQRAMIGMTTSCKPRVLLCDEPTTALDVTTQLRVLRLIDSIRKATGTALVFVSHDLGVIAEICSQVAVMYQGQFVERGPTDELFATPMHPYTHGLLGAVPDIDAPDPRLFAIPGDGAAANTDISGCPFHPRCPLAVEACRSGEFPLVTVAGTDRETACIRSADVTGLHRRRDEGADD